MVLFLLVRVIGFGQQGFYVPNNAKVFFIGDSAGIFSDVINSGLIGLGKKAVIEFKGLNWSNDLSSILSDEANNGLSVSGVGGVVRFSAKTFRQFRVNSLSAVNCEKSVLFSVTA